LTTIPKLTFIFSSKALLMKFMASSYVIDKIGIKNFEEIMTFLRKVFTLEYNFAACYFHNVRCFKEYSNTPLEGTNSGLKYGEFRVLRSMNMTTSASKMITQDDMKLLKQRQNPELNLLSRRLCNLGSENGRFITLGVWGDLQRQIDGAHSFISLRTSVNIWNVVLSKDTVIDCKPGLYPTFDRIRSVILNERGVLCCDCGYTVQYGIPCRHIAHVSIYYSNCEYVFSHEDVDVRWWTIYSKFVAISDPNDLNPTFKEIRSNLLRIRKADEVLSEKFVPKPYIGLSFILGRNVLNVSEKVSLQDVLLIFDRPKSIVRNYSFDECKKAADLFGDGHAGGIGIIGYNGDENDIEDGDACAFDDSSTSSDEMDFAFDNKNYSNRVLLTTTEITLAKLVDERVNSYELFTPKFKEFITTIEYAPLNIQRQYAKEIDDVLMRLKSDLNTFPPPKGTLVSSAMIRCHAQ
jgi:hypothetical protein